MSSLMTLYQLGQLLALRLAAKLRFAFAERQFTSDSISFFAQTEGQDFSHLIWNEF